jgi:ABC-type transporter Mla MlaB component
VAEESIIATEFIGEQAKLRFIRRGRAQADVARLYRDISGLIHRPGVRVVVLNLAEVETIDTAFINAIRALVGEASAAGRRLVLENAPRILRFALSGISYRFSWVDGVLPVDPDTPAGVMLARSRPAQP